MPQLSIFPTELGWFGLLGETRSVRVLAIGHMLADEVRAAMAPRLVSDAGAFEESDWYPELRVRLQQYASGRQVDFCDIAVNVPRRTPFQQRVVATVRQIPYGGTATYGRVAKEARSPRAARAVGRVMATNPVPLIIPCHRVVAAGGKLGGFSAPQGIVLKSKLLVMEGATRNLSGGQMQDQKANKRQRHVLRKK